MEKHIIWGGGNREIHQEMGYSPAVKSGDLLFISGQVGIDDQGQVPADASAQIELVFEKTLAILKEAGADFSHVLDIQSFHVGLKQHAEAFMAVKGRYLSAEPYPAWTAIGIDALWMPELIVEMKTIARVP